MPANTNLVMAGGVYATGGSVQTLNNTLKLSSSSGIDMGVGGFSTLTVQNSIAVAWTAGSELSILNWSGNVNSGSGTDQFIVGVGGLTTGAGGQVSQIHFHGEGSVGYNGATLLPAVKSCRLRSRRRSRATGMMTIRLHLPISRRC